MNMYLRRTKVILSYHTLFSDNCCCTLISSFFNCRLSDVSWLKTSMSAVAEGGLDRRPGTKQAK